MKISRKKSSILIKILLPMVIVAALQAAVFLGIVFTGGVAERMDNNAYTQLAQQVQNRRNEFQNKMKKWSDIGLAADEVTRLYQSYREAFPAADEKNAEFLLQLKPVVVSMLRENRVNGVFFIFAQENREMPSAESPQVQYGVGIRDLDPESANRNNGDIVLERGPSVVVPALGFALDSWWEAAYSFTDAQESDYYYRPLAMAGENQSRKPLDYGYWSAPHRVSGEDTEMVSYSVPLFDKAGRVFGVLGIELSQNYIVDHLPSGELSEGKSGVYVLAQKGGRGFVPVYSDGRMYTRYFPQEDVIALEPKALASNCYNTKAGLSQSPAVVAVTDIATYSPNSPYYEDSYYLLGAMDRGEVLAFSGSVKIAVIVASLGAFFLSIAGAYIASRVFSIPVKGMADKVRSGLGASRKLGRVGIYEIDELIQTIEQMNIRMDESENRVSEIIRMSGLLVGTFQVAASEGRVFISDEFYAIMGDVFPRIYGPEPLEGFNRKMADLAPCIVPQGADGTGTVYHFSEIGKWVRVKTSESGGRLLGVVMDVTAEMQEREKIEYERDHDILTNLLNRRAFHAQLARLFSAPEKLGVAAMVMMDVDNLKYINDSFGHDLGDSYLKKVASVIRQIENENSVISRISGDEFLLFLHGFDSREPIFDCIQQLKAAFAAAVMPLPGGEKMRVRVSGGVAWYPEDSREMNALIKFADFAMLQTKKSHKGNFDYFVSEDYRQNRYLVESVDEINRMIDDELLDFHFQPIVDVRAGSVYGYEALMRPTSPNISGPAEALILAEAVGSLYQMERLTWLGALKKFSENAQGLDRDIKLFINSIPNQCLSDRDRDFVVEHYGHMLERVVVEIIETEKTTGQEGTSFKRLEPHGVRLAIDDYGSGYNSQTMLLGSRADYIKIDMSIVRGVEKDANRQEIIRDIVTYSGGRGIQVIAEGVETEEELKALLRLRVGLVQGFLLQRPAPTPLSLKPQTVALLRGLAEQTNL